MKFEITKEDKVAIKRYKNEKKLAIDQLLTDAEKELSLATEQGQDIEYTEENVAKTIEDSKIIYEVICKSFSNMLREKCTFYQCTTMEEIEQLKTNCLLPSFWKVTSDQEKVQNELKSNPSFVMLEIEESAQLPYLKLEEILQEEKNEFLLAPFLKVKKIEEIKDAKNTFKAYRLTLEREILEENKTSVSDSEILKKASEISKKIQTCMELDAEISNNYENIRKLEQLLAKHNFAMEQENYEADTTEEERQSDLDDMDRINAELTTLKETATQIFYTRQEKIKSIADWKKDIWDYLKSEFKKIDEKYERLSQEQIKSEKEVPKEEPKKKLSGDPFVASIKADAQENVAVVNTLLNNIKNLIAKQQNHARIAEEMDSNYKALNNAFEMKNFAEELDSLVKAILTKIDTLSSEKKEELEKISKTNLQVNILLNYLNNAKAAAGKRISRFDEIQIIEENELKKEIAETIKNIRCEAELKKLRDDLDIIEDKSRIKKFFGRFTGRNKLDKTMLDQIQVRQTAIRKTFKAKMPLAYNYSIHELIAEIEMFIKENEEDELVLEDVSALRKIRDVLKKNFVIMDSKVVSIIDQKTGKNLPLSSKKISKQELIEIDTYRFLNKYGYDKDYRTQEPGYQDTLANEIKRIVDYIKSSDVL